MLNFFKKHSNHNLISSEKVNNWALTDIIIGCNDIVFNQIPDFSNRYGLYGSYVCIRDFKQSCIYIHEQDLDKFMNDSYFYDKNRKLVNLSRILEFKVNTDCYAQVMNKAVPPYITIKQVVDCRIKNSYHVYILRMIVLDRSFELFDDLMNLQIVKNNFINEED